jgi:hypothetical protein
VPQSNVIFFYLFAAFLVFITMRGELPKYLGFLLASPVNGANKSALSRGPDLPDLSRSPDFGKIANIAKVAALF